MTARESVQSSELRVQRKDTTNYELRTTNSLGFTLVELLVVIIIIAILATIGLVMYGSAQKQARISKRIQDLKAIQTALQLYYSVNKAYPISASWTSCNVAITGLVPDYMPAFPSDPQKSGGCYDYTSSSSNGGDYKMRDTAPEMTSSDYESQPNLIDPKQDGGVSTGSGPCTVDTTTTGTISAWAVWSSCKLDGSSCSGSCTW